MKVEALRESTTLHLCMRIVLKKPQTELKAQAGLPLNLEKV